MAGARTQLYNFFVAMAVLFTILFLDSLFYYLPKVVLASIIIVAAVGTSLSLQPSSSSPFPLQPPSEEEAG
jgi:MFS superfamily sulfate permease-like transporter